MGIATPGVARMMGGNQSKSNRSKTNLAAGEILAERRRQFAVMTEGARQLSRWRIKAGFNQAQACRWLNVSLRQYVRWETGENRPGPERWQEIERVTGISPLAWL